jgi:hypothetical protein
MSDYDWGRDCGASDANHPSGVMTHLSHRDPEAWAQLSDDLRRGYDQGWRENHPAYPEGQQQ